jgi:hypothetical protein
VIVRCWKGIATTDNAKKYIEHLDRSIMPILRTLHADEAKAVLSTYDKTVTHYEEVTFN